jgi:hypothetical protein
MQTSRHHYIPIYYLKEFADDDGKFHVYDVLNMQIKPIKQSPKQIGFEWDRNVTDFNGTKTDEVETKFYQHIDNYISRKYKELIKSNQQTTISEADYLNLQHLAISLYFRNPIFDNKIEQIIKESSVSDFGLENEILKSEYFIETLRTILPAWKLYQLPDCKIKRFRLSYKPDSQKNKTIISDCPIIFNTDSPPKDDIFECEFILPISSKITLYYTNNVITSFRLEPEDFIKVHLLLIKQARSFVASNDKEYLNNLVNVSNQFSENYLRETLFSKMK